MPPSPPSRNADAVADQVAESIRSLPQRFLPGRVPSTSPKVFTLRIGEAARHVLVVDSSRCTVWPDTDEHRPDATIATDSQSWLDLIEGRVSGLELFFRGALEVGGDLNDALAMDTLFARPAGSPWAAWHPQVQQVSVEMPMVTGRTRRVSIETYTAGPPDAPPVVFIHGLGASKVSLLPVMAGVATTHRVVALDLPGFGHSDAPLDAPYTPGWLALAVRRVLDRLDVRNPVLVGNSLGGWTSVEVALAAPGAVRGLFLLCPAVGFKQYRPIRRVLGLTRPDAPLAALPVRTTGPVARRVLDRLLVSLFADATRVPAQNLTAARDDALRTIADPRHRYALLATARQIGLVDDRAYWARLADLTTPSCWIFGDADVLVSPAYAKPVREILPEAEVEVWDSTGHVPQFEHRERTAARLAEFLAALPLLR
jgi:pimeloyl-ACP methyl ester carboxylesterase/putative sterol carrier protein